MTNVWPLAALLALVLANALFVAAEFAIVGAQDAGRSADCRRAPRSPRGSARGQPPDRYIAATQLGITMASLGLGWAGEPALASLIEPQFAFLPVSIAATTSHTIAFAIAFTCITGIEMVFGELTPKWIALETSGDHRAVDRTPLEVFMRVLWPFIRLVHGSAQSIVRLLGLHGADRHTMVHSEEELKMLVTASQEAGVLEEGEEQMLHRVFGFADLAAGQVMTPRTELVAVPADTPLDAVARQIADTNQVRLAVYRADLDDIVGFVHATDLVRVLAARAAPTDAGALAREALTVPETLGADDLLAEMRRRRVREALVIDEYGGTAGMVTFEALMERIVGEVGGEFGASARIVVRPDGSADIDGLTLVGDGTPSSGCISTKTPIPRSGYVLGGSAAARVGDTIEIEGRRMRVDDLDRLRCEGLAVDSAGGVERN
jgi:CBS domain containing-hemolysin-like protein